MTDKEIRAAIAEVRQSTPNNPGVGWIEINLGTRRKWDSFDYRDFYDRDVRVYLIPLVKTLATACEELLEKNGNLQASLELHEEPTKVTMTQEYWNEIQDALCNVAQFIDYERTAARAEQKLTPLPFNMCMHCLKEGNWENEDICPKCEAAGGHVSPWQVSQCEACNQKFFDKMAELNAGIAARTKVAR